MQGLGVVEEDVALAEGLDRGSEWRIARVVCGTQDQLGRVELHLHVRASLVIAVPRFPPGPFGAVGPHLLHLGLPTQDRHKVIILILAPTAVRTTRRRRPILRREAHPFPIRRYSQLKTPVMLAPASTVALRADPTRSERGASCRMRM